MAPERDSLGSMKYRDDMEAWGGEIHLPLFAELRDVGEEKELAVWERSDDESVVRLREMKRLRRREEQRQSGKFPLEICVFEEEPPSKAQVQAIEHLIDHEAEVLDAVLDYLLDTFTGNGFWTLEGFKEDPTWPEVKSREDLRNCLRLESVLIDVDEDPDLDRSDELLAVVLRFSSPLDEEHGLEITVIGTEVEDPYWPGRGLEFPFTLPDGVDASEIEASDSGHRFVEFLYGGKWSGVFVLDPSLQCVGIVFSSHPRRLSDPSQIQDVRGLSPWRRWQASLRNQNAVLSALGYVNWFIALPCLVLGWLYEPRLFGVCIALALIAHAGYYAIGRSGERLFGLATGYLVASVVGLVYASRVPDFGSARHVKNVSGAFGSLAWWGTLVIAVIASSVVVSGGIALRKNLLRHPLSVLLFLFPALFVMAGAVAGLVLTYSGDWSPLHLWWFTPTMLVTCLLLMIGVAIVAPWREPSSAPCPECGKPLATAQAQQCLHCGADWHRAGSDGDE